VRKFYLTTAIDYPNALPHIGTAYEKVCADIIARYKRLGGWDTFFVMGSDEHSHNVERAAREQGLEPRQFTDIIAPKFEQIWKMLNISYDCFERSSSQRHKKAVQDIFQKIYDAGDIYKGHYEGWYCNSCERFYQEKDLIENKECPHHKRPVEWVKEENYIFALSRYREKLLDLLQEDHQFAMPEARRNEMLSFLKMGLDDVSVSRASVSWGIPLPFDPSHMVYVWFDALICYVSGIGYGEDPDKFSKYWPADVHIIGKDITRFHCVMWPAMLMSAGIDLPRMVWAHGFVHLGGEKLSKSAGLSVDPIEAAERHGADALRYYLVREIPFDRDGNFAWEKFDERYDSDLANNLGNLLQRSIAMIQKYCNGEIPTPAKLDSSDTEVVDFQQETYKNVCADLDQYRLSFALGNIWTFITRCNKYIEESAPWELKKDPAKKEKLNTVLGNLARAIKFIGGAIAPFMPETAEKVWTQIGLGDQFAAFKYADLSQLQPIPAGTRVLKPVPLFPKTVE